MNTPSAMLLFLKLPQPGQVKTRLAKVLGDQEAASLYTLFVEDLLVALDCVPAKLTVYCAPQEGTPDADTLAAVRDWLGPDRDYRLQQGSDLGERMAHALDTAFQEGADRAVLIGSDIPDFPAPLLAKALDDLRRMPVLLGPALDGGYYLIGFQRQAFTHTAFTNITWSRPNVLDATLTRLKSAGLDAGFLPPWNDVDDIWDLNALYRLNLAGSFAQSRTMAALEEKQELLARYDLHMEMPGCGESV